MKYYACNHRLCVSDCYVLIAVYHDVILYFELFISAHIPYPYCKLAVVFFIVCLFVIFA